MLWFYILTNEEICTHYECNVVNNDPDTNGPKNESKLRCLAEIWVSNE